MSPIQIYGEKVNLHLGSIHTSVEEVAQDVRALKDELVKTQNHVGPITPEVQKYRDNVNTRLGAVQTKLTALAVTTSKPIPVPSS